MSCDDFSFTRGIKDVHISLVRRYKFKDGNIEGYKFRVIDFHNDLFDLTEGSNYWGPL